MTAVIAPSKAHGTAAAPPSKSMAHRMLLCAGLCPGESTVRGVADSEDTLATIDCLRALGAQVEKTDGIVRVRGIRDASEHAVLPCRECGSTLRFFVPVALLRDAPVTLTGSRTLLARPLSVYARICREQGLSFDLGADALTVRGKLRAGRFSVPGDVSSQFVSGLLFALPLLDADSVIDILPPVQSEPYIRMTLQALGAFGVSARMEGTRITVPGGQAYMPRDAEVEGDWSNAAFPDALQVLGGNVRVTGLRDDSLQGDKVYREYFALLDAGAPTLDLSDCPDLGPVCMALAAAKHGAHFTGTRRLRLKESDRCACMAAELAKFGVRCEVGEDDMTVCASPLQTPAEPLSGHNDHRIVMALSLLLSVTGGRIEGAEAVRKSWPEYFTVLRSLGIEVDFDGMDT